MLDYHIDRDGNSMPIAMMSNDHLRNTINLHLKAGLAVKTAGRTEIAVDDYTMALYKTKRLSADRAGTKVRDIVIQLYPYLSEAFLRTDTLHPAYFAETRQMLSDLLARPLAPESALLLPNPDF